MKITPPIILLVCANLLPIIGVLWWDWSVFPVMLLFWIENIIVGLLNIPRILFAVGDSEEQHTKLSARLPLAAFFAVHYGMFTFGHGKFVFAMFAPETDVDLSPELVLQLIQDYQLVWMVLALFVSHLVSLIMKYFLAGEYQMVSARKMMFKPYNRIIILHVTILLGGMLLQFLHEPIAGLLALILVKIVVDVRAHIKEHNELSVTMRDELKT